MKISNVMCCAIGLLCYSSSFSSAPAKKSVPDDALLKLALQEVVLSAKIHKAAQTFNSNNSQNAGEMAKRIVVACCDMQEIKKQIQEMQKTLSSFEKDDNVIKLNNVLSRQLEKTNKMLVLSAPVLAMIAGKIGQIEAAKAANKIT